MVHGWMAHEPSDPTHVRGRLPTAQGKPFGFSLRSSRQEPEVDKQRSIPGDPSDLWH